MELASMRQRTKDLLRVVAIVGAGSLAACTPVAVRKPGTTKQLAAQAAREHALGAQQSWGLDGRFAASDGQHGGSGSLSWQQTGQQYQFTLRAPITGKSVQLNGGPNDAVLTGMGKQALAGRSAGDVLNAEFGWDVPVADLSSKIRPVAVSIAHVAARQELRAIMHALKLEPEAAAPAA